MSALQSVCRVFATQATRLPPIGLALSGCEVVFYGPKEVLSDYVTRSQNYRIALENRADTEISKNNDVRDLKLRKGVVESVLSRGAIFRILLASFRTHPIEPSNLFPGSIFRRSTSSISLCLSTSNILQNDNSTPSTQGDIWAQCPSAARPSTPPSCGDAMGTIQEQSIESSQD
jgi:hypothetical protein